MISIHRGRLRGGKTLRYSHARTIMAVGGDEDNWATCVLEGARPGAGCREKTLDQEPLGAPTSA